MLADIYPVGFHLSDYRSYFTVHLCQDFNFYPGHSANSQRWARSPPFGDLEDQDQIIKKCDLEDQRSDHPNTVILKIKITLLLVLKEK